MTTLAGAALLAAGALVVLPVDNRSAGPIPDEDLRATLVAAVEDVGLAVVSADAVETVLAAERVRYTGGVSDNLAGVLRERLGSTAALVTTIDVWDPADPPAIALTARLVDLSGEPRILWIDGVSLVGDEAPGFLGLATVHDIVVLEQRAAAALAEGLGAALAGRPRKAPRAGGRFDPVRLWVRPSSLPPGGEDPLRVAVLPFRNKSERRHAGDLVALQMLRHLTPDPRLRPIDPGEIRAVLLRTRLVAEHGVSVPQIELLRETLSADLVVTGTVFEYFDGRGIFDPPAVDFTSLVFDAREARLAASALSANGGDDGVYLFDWGRSWTAHTLVSRMSERFVREVFGLTAPRTRSIVTAP